MSTTAAQTPVVTSRFLNHLHSPQRPVLVFDGATGTSLQQLNLTAEDFGGAELEGCNENLVVTRPDAVQTVHRQFLEACLLYTSPSPRDRTRSRMPSSA